MVKQNFGLLILFFLLIIFIMCKENKEHILAQPSHFKTMEDVYKARLKDNKGLNYNDYILEGQLLLDKDIGIKNRIL